jgi:hypothetical protein
VGIKEHMKDNKPHNKSQNNVKKILEDINKIVKRANVPQIFLSIM